MVEPVIALQNLSVKLGGRRVLDDVSLSIPAGATGLLGPNGAGKTTLIRTLLGLLPPRRGRVAVLGLSARRHGRAIRERVGYMPEDNVALPRRNAVESVMLLAELSGLPHTEALERTHEVLWYVGLGEARFRPVEQFSAGMRQRFKLAAALAADPDLLVLDEPTNGLDPDGRREILDLLVDLSKNHNKSLLLSTHLLGDVERVCSRVVVLDRGKLVRQADVRPELDSPEVAYVVRLSGETNGYVEALKQRGIVPRALPGAL